jgi:hypothetical protein
MITQIKRWEIQCDRCDTSVFADSYASPPLPDGWTIEEVGPCGLTGYVRKELRCPACSDTKDKETVWPQNPNDLLGKLQASFDRDKGEHR